MAAIHAIPVSHTFSPRMSYRRFSMSKRSSTTTRSSTLWSIFIDVQCSTPHPESLLMEDLRSKRPGTKSFGIAGLRVVFIRWIGLRRTCDSPALRRDGIFMSTIETMREKVNGRERPECRQIRYGKHCNDIHAKSILFTIIQGTSEIIIAVRIHFPVITIQTAVSKPRYR